MGTRPPVTTIENELGAKQQFEMIKDLPVLENYDELSKFDALSELSSTAAARPATEQALPANPDGGGQ